jgi:hypothetical protein
MERKQILPLILIIIDIGAALACVPDGDWKKVVYWSCAAALSWSVTF